MPIYEYVCGKCAHEFEELILGRQDTVACPKCASQETRKMVSRCRSRIGGATSISGAGGSAAGGCSSCSAGSCASCG